MSSGRSRKSHGYSVYSDRYEITQENEWEKIEEYERDENLGRDIFRCYVLDASDYVDPSIDGSVGSYIFAKLMPVDWLSGRTEPCGPYVSAQERDFIISDYISAKSETKLGDTRYFPLSPGDIVWAYWIDPAKHSEGAVFMLNKIEKNREGNYMFECLKIKRSKPSLKYNSPGSGTPATVPKATTEPFSIKEHPKCFNWKHSNKTWSGKFAREKFGIPAGGVHQVYNGRFNQLPNSTSYYRGGQFQKKSLVHEINALKELGVRIIYRFNGGVRAGEPTVAEEKAAVEAAGLTFVFRAMSGGNIFTKSEWEAFKDQIVQGGVYFHCHAGVDRTGAVAARWILETSMVHEGALKLTDARRTEVLNYTMAHGGAWKYAHKDDDEDKTKKGSAKRTGIRDSCANKKQKDFGFDVDTGYNVERTRTKSGKSGFKYGDLVPDVERAVAAIGACPDWAAGL
jgi:protein tyrosine phosphatase (PTP) superfamily phosphohydrolase (DUF442 family)